MKAHRSRIDEFWKHIADNLHLLATISSAEDEPYDAALEHLQAIHPNLYFVIGNKPSGGELIITAEGDTTLFDLVDEIVVAAPPMPGWSITALKPRCSFPEFARWNSVRIELREVYFEPLEAAESGALGIRVLVPNLTDSIAKDARLALIQAIEFALGERAFAVEVQYVELALKNPASDNDIPLGQLEEYIAWRNKRRGG